MRKIKKMQSILILSIMLLLFCSSKSDTNAADYSSWAAVFNPAYYNSHCSDAAIYANGNVDKLWEYFVNVGIPRGDQASEEFNIFIYAKNYPELIKQFRGNYLSYYVHYATVGKAAGLNAKTLINKPSTTTNTTQTNTNTQTTTTTTQSTNDQSYSTTTNTTNCVYVTESGQKYHRSSSCSNMKNPQKISLSEAQNRGYTSCKKCY